MIRNERNHPRILRHHHVSTAGLGTGSKKGGIEEDQEIQRMRKQVRGHSDEQRMIREQQQRLKDKENEIYYGFSSPEKPFLATNDPSSLPTLSGWQLSVLCLLATIGVLVVLFLHAISVEGSSKSKKKKHSGGGVAYHHHRAYYQGSLPQQQQHHRRKKKVDEWSEDEYPVDESPKAGSIINTATTAADRYGALKKQGSNQQVVYPRRTLITPLSPQNKNKKVQKHISGLTGLGQEEDPLFDNKPYLRSNVIRSDSESSAPPPPPPPAVKEGERDDTCDSPRPRISTGSVSPCISPLNPMLHTPIPVYLKSNSSISAASHSSQSSTEREMSSPKNNTNVEGMVIRLPSPPSSFSSSDSVITSSSRPSSSDTPSSNPMNPPREQEEMIIPFYLPQPPVSGLRQRRNNPPDSLRLAKAATPKAANKKPPPAPINLPPLPNLEEQKEEPDTSFSPPTMDELVRDTTLFPSKIQLGAGQQEEKERPQSPIPDFRADDKEEEEDITKDWKFKLPPTVITSEEPSPTPPQAKSPNVKKKSLRKQSTIDDSASSALSTSTTTQIAYEDLKLNDVIGGGGFGQVWSASWKGTPVAVKILSPTQDNDSRSKNLLQEFAAEIQMLSGMRHPNICLYIGACLTPPHQCIITELAVNGSVWDALRKPLLNLYYEAVNKDNVAGLWPRYLYDGEDEKINEIHKLIPTGTWPWNLVKKVASGAARGMTYLHTGTSTPVLHRDLKSANLLLDESYNTKVADFGLSRLKASSEDSGSIENSMTGNCGTVQWMAPEVLANERYAEPADVFSFGIILWELLTRECPYEGMTPIQCAMAVLNQRYRPEIPKWCPEKFRELVLKCLEHEPKERPGFAEILAGLDAIP